MTEMFVVSTLIAITVGVLVLGGVVTAHPARVMHVTAYSRVVHSVDMTDGPPAKPVSPNLAPNVVQTNVVQTNVVQTNVVQTMFCICYQCMGKDRCWRARGPPEHDLRRTKRGRFVVVNPLPCYRSFRSKPLTTESASHPVVTRDNDSVKLN